MLRSFIHGFLLGAIGTVVINCLDDLISQTTELVKGKMRVKLVEYNSKITNSNVNAIGFSIPNEEDDVEYEE